MKAKDINALIAKTPAYVAEFILTKSYTKNRGRGGMPEYGFAKGCLVRATAYEGTYRTAYNDGLFSLPASVLKFTRYVQVQ